MIEIINKWDAICNYKLEYLFPKLYLPLSLSTNFGRILHGFSMTNTTNTGTDVNVILKPIRGNNGDWITGIISRNREMHTMTDATGKINQACNNKNMICKINAVP